MKTPATRTPISRSWAWQAGFTIPEMILVVAVLGILLSVTAAPLYQFVRQRDVQQENNSQSELQKSLDAYIENTRILPTDVIDENTASANYNNNWFVQLARFGKLSPSQLRFDAWGNERRYMMYTTTQNLFGNNVPIYYATITSAGPDDLASSKLCANGTGAFTSNSAAGGALNGYRAPTDACQWKNQSVPVTAYNNLGTVTGATGSPTDDDILLKFTDYPAKMDKYQQTLDRLNKVSDALGTYAKQQYANAVAVGVISPTQLIYAPKTITSDVQPDSWYATQVITDTKQYNNSKTAFDSLNTSSSLRRKDMVDLMRLLGLPDEMCCSGLSTFTDTDGAVKEEPFYYSGNPRPRINGGCGTRPDPTITSPLPARVGVTLPTVTQACY